MNQLPDRPDAGQIRIRAKELQRALTGGDPDARQRVLESHPKFAGRPAERMEGWTFTLRDAQVTLAREYGFDSWKDLMGEVEGEGVTRWRVDRWTSAVERSMKLAHQLGHRFVVGEHVLLVLLSPMEPTPASELLTDLGMTYDDVLERLERMRVGIDDEEKGTRSTPVFHMLSSFAQGLAVGMGATTITDEHVLLAISYVDPAGDNLLVNFGFDSDDLVDGLRARGISVPRLAPPVMSPPSGPWGSTVYFLIEDSSGVFEELRDRFPPGTALWGTNTSTWKEGYIYVHGEDEIPMEAIVKGVVRDPATVEVLSFEEAIAGEGEGRRR